MGAIVVIFGLPLLLAAAMVSRNDLSLSGFLSCVAVVGVALPFIGWRTFLIAAVFPSSGESRSESLVRLWIGGTLVVVGVFYFLGSVLDYPPAGIRIAADAHLLIPFAPRTGLAIGLFVLCQLVACGLVGAIAPILRPEIVLRSAVQRGTALFGLLYGAGWLLVVS